MYSIQLAVVTKGVLAGFLVDVCVCVRDLPLSGFILAYRFANTPSTI